MFCLVRFVESGIFCTNPQTGRDGHHASVFDQLISIWNPVFRSQNLNDNAADAESRSPALSANRIYAFWKLSGGEIAALKSWNMPKVFVWRSRGLHRPCTQTDVVTLTRQSARSRTTAPQRGMCWLNTVYRSSLLGWCFFSLHCFGLATRRMGDEDWGWEVRGPCLDQRVGRLVVGGFDRHAVILCFCALAAACGSSAQLMFDFGCFLELQPGMCCSKDKRAIRQTAADQ